MEDDSTRPDGPSVDHKELQQAYKEAVAAGDLIKERLPDDLVGPFGILAASIVRLNAARRKGGRRQIDEAMQGVAEQASAFLTAVMNPPNVP